MSPATSPAAAGPLAQAHTGGATAAPARGGPPQRIARYLARPQTLFRLALLNAFCQILICVTGVTVRVTASGLGCETWPQCHPGSFTPVAGSAPALHQAVEFGNRMLTFVLIMVSVTLLLAVIAAGRRGLVRRLVIATPLLVLSQGVIGGLTVLAGLKWWTVALHLLPSMVLVWISGVIVVRIRESDVRGTAPGAAPTALRVLAGLSAAALAGVIITGTMVTGAGPHAGDERVLAGDRLQIDIPTLVHTHAQFFIAYATLVVGLICGLYAVGAVRHLRTMAAVTLGFVLLQGVVGFVQYRTGVPEIGVIIHMFLAGIIVARTAALFAMLAPRGPRVAAADRPAT